MKIAIVSDTHDNMANFKKAIDYIKKEGIKLILHCGDIQSRETIDGAMEHFGGEIKFAKGNGDHGLEIPEKVELDLEDFKIGFCHFPAEAKKMAQSGFFDLVFYGHTHRAWDEKVNNTHMINPGELAGQFYKPTFAIYDTASEKLELKILEKI